jgi:hypothetical protein
MCAPIDPGATYVPGDGIDQRDSNRLFFGGYLTYTKFWSLFSLPIVGEFPMQTQLGLQFRRDQMDVALFRQVKRRVFFGVNQVAIAEQSVSGFWGQQFFFTDWARLEAGVRGDVFFFNVDNRLPPQKPDPNFVAEPINGNKISGLASPKVDLVFGPWQNTELYVNYGNGFHSNDARVVVQTGEAVSCRRTATRSDRGPDSSTGSMRLPRCGSSIWRASRSSPGTPAASSRAGRADAGASTSRPAISSPTGSSATSTSPMPIRAFSTAMRSRWPRRS